MKSIDSNTLSSLNALRRDIEQEQRFKTAINGYDKNSVNDYLNKLFATFQSAMSELEAENENLKNENRELYAKLSEQEKMLAAYRGGDRFKTSSFSSSSSFSSASASSSGSGDSPMREGMVKTLRAANEQLMDENRRKQLEITNLQQQISNLRASVMDSASTSAMLSQSLDEMLHEKLNECSEIIASWQHEFQSTIDSVTDYAESTTFLMNGRKPTKS